MKYIKLLTIALATTSMVACSDDDANWNSASDVTVSMAQTEISVKENKGIFNVPVSVEGEANGPIQVTVEVAEVGENPAMDDVHYLVTSKTIVIPADATTGNIEISTVDNGEINEARQFDITIVSVEGAQVGANITTTVNLKDNDAAFYEKLQGAWKMNFTSRYDGEASWSVNVVGYDEGEEGYDKTLFINGVLGYSFCALEMSYFFDTASKSGYVEIPLGTYVADYDDANGIYACTVTDDGSLALEGSIKGQWNEDFTEITFEEDKQLILYVINNTTGAGLGVMDWIWAIKMNK
ncbi:MAG: hypothetical protein IJC40_03980 [Muribaculaceae bacterium]|nr:hypothetical protein [Muribaculaceae bacterium]